MTVVGYPLGQALTVTTGPRHSRATTTRCNENLGEVLVTDAPVEPGSSGSAVLDADGRVVGVVYAKDADGTSFVVPVSTLRSMLDDEAAFAPAAPCYRLTTRRTTMTDVPRFDPAHLTSAVSDTVTVRRVFGEAYECDGTLVIPVARVWARDRVRGRRAARAAADRPRRGRRRARRARRRARRGRRVRRARQGRRRLRRRRRRARTGSRRSTSTA